MIEALLFFAVTTSLYAWGRKIDRDNERAGFVGNESTDL